MAGFIGRVAIILATGLAALTIGVLAADSIPYPSPPASFDAVFSRYLDDIWTIAAAGLIPGSILASRWRMGRDPAAARRDGSIAAGLLILLLWTALLGAA